MRLRTFAESLQRLEAVRSRLATVKIVAQLLSGAGAGSIEAVGAKLLVRVLAEAWEIVDLAAMQRRWPALYQPSAPHALIATGGREGFASRPHGRWNARPG
jgi:hypothetical protein